MAAPDRKSSEDSPTTPESTPGYPETQPRDGDEARNRGPSPRKQPEEGGLERDADGGEDSDAS